MTQRPSPRLALAITGTLALMLSSPAQAQPDDPSRTLQLRPLGPGTYWSAEGGTVGIIVGTDGVILVDATGSPRRAGELTRAIAKITPKPIKAVILTHVDEDHVGGVSGLPEGIAVYAQRETQKLLKADAAAKRGPVPSQRLPTKVIDGSRTLVIDGVKVEMLHWGPAHTAGDLVVYLPERKIVFASDIFCLDQPRAYIKPELGGSAAGWAKAAEGVAALDATHIVAGHGGVATKPELERFIQLSLREREQIIALVRQGKPLAEIEKTVGEPQPTVPPPPPSIHQANFAKAVYLEQTQGR